MILLSDSFSCSIFFEGYYCNYLPQGQYSRGLAPLRFNNFGPKPAHSTRRSESLSRINYSQLWILISFMRYSGANKAAYIDLAVKLKIVSWCACLYMQ